MVKSLDARISTTSIKIVPKITVLRLKALLRANLMNPAQEATVGFLKDSDAKALIDAYDLDLRGKLNAWECWRELYFSFFGTKQEVLTMEQASAPYTVQTYIKQPYNIEGV
jgi:hypothetical protein